MLYKDIIFGEFRIEEPVILELINSKSLQRLKGINQAGYLPSLYGLKIKNLPFLEKEYNRFTHSLGVYLLLLKFGAPLEEQVAGLIHDVSHSAFSHIIDYVLEEGSETEHSYQDNVFVNFVRKSEIPQILEKYNLDLEYILDENNFPLKERELPDLCADRLEYSLRSAFLFGEIRKEDVDLFSREPFY